VDVRQDTTTCDGRTDELIEFFVTSDGELEMSGSDTLYSEILGGVTCE
jgi:hypothetical protein